MRVSAETRRVVIRRSGSRCEYCRVPAGALDDSMHVEHVRARQHRGANAADNLALACRLCNLHKGTNLAGVDPLTDQTVLLFDPRRMSWPEHFEADGAEVVGLTPEGRTTVALLRMNGEDRLALRTPLAEAGEWP